MDTLVHRTNIIQHWVLNVLICCQSKQKLHNKVIYWLLCWTKNMLHNKVIPLSQSFRTKRKNVFWIQYSRIRCMSWSSVRHLQAPSLKLHNIAKLQYCTRIKLPFCPMQKDVFRLSWPKQKDNGCHLAAARYLYNICLYFFPNVRTNDGFGKACFERRLRMTHLLSAEKDQEIEIRINLFKLKIEQK